MNTIRKLAREIVIFALAAGFVGAVVGLVIEQRELHPRVLTEASKAQPVKPRFDPNAPYTACNPDAAEKILRPLAVSHQVKHDSWEAYYASANVSDLTAALTHIALPEDSKTALEAAKTADIAAAADFKKFGGSVNPPCPPQSDIAQQPTVEPDGPIPATTESAVTYLSSAGRVGMLGMFIGIVLWVLYRLVQFAVTG
jgi:hypothetical protein